MRRLNLIIKVAIGGATEDAVASNVSDPGLIPDTSKCFFSRVIGG